MSELYTPAAVAPPQAADAAGAGLGLTDSIYNRLLKERIIWLGSEVRDDNANAICAQMLLLAAEDPERDIYLYINSPGGSVTAGMAIYDTMEYVQPDVVTVATGMAASMGQFLLSALSLMVADRQAPGDRPHLGSVSQKDVTLSHLHSFLPAVPSTFLGPARPSG